MAMGFSSTLSVFKCGHDLLPLGQSALSGVLGGALAGWSKLLVAAVIALTVALLLDGSSRPAWGFRSAPPATART